MARRLFLHIGTPKSGTTYLQSVLWNNKGRLRQQGLLLPLEKFQAHFHLSVLARDAPAQLATLGPRALTAWERMSSQVSGWEGDALISHELFAYASPERVKWTTERLHEVSDELHIVVTARDLARQVPAEWQETIKHGGVHGLHAYYELVRARSTEIGFWTAQDLVRLMTQWGSGLPPAQVHLVTLPPKGAPPNLLLDRFTDLIGVDATSFDTSVSRPNESLGVAEIEMLRRCNLAAPTEQIRSSKHHLNKVVLAEGILADRPGAQRFAPAPEDHAWAVQAGTAIVKEIAALPYDVIGDVLELQPVAEPLIGPSPDEVTDTQVAAVAVETIPTLLFELGDALKEARQNFNDERNIPLKTHIRRRLGLIKRNTLKRVRR